MRVDFDYDTHSYSVAGVPVPSVTEILAAERLADPVNQYAARYAGRGTMMHECISRLECDLSIPEKIPDKVASRLLSYTKFKSSFKSWNMELVDYPVLCESHWYAGTLDWFGFLDEIPTIIDWKWSEWKKSYGPQLGGYKYALSGSYFIDREIKPSTVQLLVVLLDAKGRLPRVKAVDSRSSTKIFLSAANIYHWRNS